MPAKRRVTVVRVTGFLSISLQEADSTLREVLQNEISEEERPTSKLKVTIVPSCEEGCSPVGLIDFEYGLPAFLSELAESPLGECQMEIDDTDEYLTFDRHFHGFTQLYYVEPSSIVAE